MILTHCVAAHCHLCAKRPWEMFSSLQSLDLLMPTGFFFHWPRLLSKYELRIVRVPFTVILNDAWLDRKFHFSCIVIVDIKFQNNYSWKVSGFIKTSCDFTHLQGSWTLFIYPAKSDFFFRLQIFLHASFLLMQISDDGVFLSPNIWVSGAPLF